MVHSCVVRNCPSLGKNDCKMHLFPKDPELFKKWIDVINREDIAAMDIEKVRKTRRICSMHFSKDLVFPDNANRSNLKHGVVPNVNLNLPKGFSYEAKHYFQLMKDIGI